jgi:outer membrane lipoprotein-sorting protein
MSIPRLWEGAGRAPVSGLAGRRPELPAHPPGPPPISELFTFMRDAELRVRSLEMRIVEEGQTARGPRETLIELLLRHPRLARVTTTFPADGTVGSYEVWLSDGETVRTYSSRRRVATIRPLRRRVAGLDDQGFPGFSRVYQPLTPLPAESLPDAFLHPAGLCQNLLATGQCRVVGDDEILGRAVVVLECHHPRAVEVHFDRPDFRLRLAVDRESGNVLGQEEWVGGAWTRRATAVAFVPDAPVPDSAFELHVPEGTRILY